MNDGSSDLNSSETQERKNLLLLTRFHIMSSAKAEDSLTGAFHPQELATHATSTPICITSAPLQKLHPGV